MLIIVVSGHKVDCITRNKFSVVYAFRIGIMNETNEWLYEFLGFTNTTVTTYAKLNKLID